MLPCQTLCNAFQSECHKTCPHWKKYQQEQAAERQAKNRYLKYYTVRCGQVARQFSAMQARYPLR